MSEFNKKLGKGNVCFYYLKAPVPHSAELKIIKTNILS